MDFDIWQRSFTLGHFGAAAAEAIYMMGIVSVLIGFWMWLQRRGQRETTRVGGFRESVRDRMNLVGRALARPFAPLAEARRARVATRTPRRRRKYSVVRTTILVLLAVPYIYPFVHMVGT